MQINSEEKIGFDKPLPSGPILDWDSFTSINIPIAHSIEDIKNKVLTTSGRAAIYQALLQLNLPAYSSVLVPTYHCPTMIAPVLLANLNVAYFGLLPTGLPNLELIDEATVKKSKVMLVPHYFGIAKSLKEVRNWCDLHGIFLIEDCAHCYFGTAGERNVGEWGDYSTASLSKFFPLPEAGMLASSNRSVRPISLKKPALISQIKGFLDVIELASKYQRFSGIKPFLVILFKLKNLTFKKSASRNKNDLTNATTMMRECDMTRISKSPLWAAIILKNILPRGRIIKSRQKNFATYTAYFSSVTGAKPLFQINSALFDSTVPYVFPLWVDEPDAIYQSLRAMKLPVFRWDRVWPNTPNLPGDIGHLWRRHVLQLLCHQDLNSADIDRIAKTVLNLLQLQQAKAYLVN